MLCLKQYKNILKYLRTDERFVLINIMKHVFSSSKSFILELKICQLQLKAHRIFKLLKHKHQLLIYILKKI